MMDNNKALLNMRINICSLMLSKRRACFIHCFIVLIWDRFPIKILVLLLINRIMMLEYQVH